MQGSLKYMHKHLLKGESTHLIPTAESLLVIFAHFSPYWNFLDYGLMEYLFIYLFILLFHLEMRKLGNQ